MSCHPVCSMSANAFFVPQYGGQQQVATTSSTGTSLYASGHSASSLKAPGLLGPVYCPFLANGHSVCLVVHRERYWRSISIVSAVTRASVAETQCSPAHSKKRNGRCQPSIVYDKQFPCQYWAKDVLIDYQFLITGRKSDITGTDCSICSCYWTRLWRRKQLHIV